MEMLLEVVFGVICYRVGYWVLRVITLGRFTGKSSYWFAVVCTVGALVILSPIITIIAWKLMESAK
ncbi:hypothetical protein [Pseudomonas sp. PGPR40]|uniref:hypothetical protein n=1 Tax=Pseudomonas sp. PGPR40 TaxID=2913476 RepID=UPI001EDA5878|nr:hypothetical protein [Pseudomonas sp. PGPR40]